MSNNYVEKLNTKIKRILCSVGKWSSRPQNHGFWLNLNSYVIIKFNTKKLANDIPIYVA